VTDFVVVVVVVAVAVVGGGVVVVALNVKKCILCSVFALGHGIMCTVIPHLCHFPMRNNILVLHL